MSKINGIYAASMSVLNDDLTLDINGNIQLDANDNGEVRFLDDGTQYAAIKNDATIFEARRGTI